MVAFSLIYELSIPTSAYVGRHMRAPISAMPQINSRCQGTYILLVEVSMGLLEHNLRVAGARQGVHTAGSRKGAQGLHGGSVRYIV